MGEETQSLHLDEGLSVKEEELGQAEGKMNQVENEQPEEVEEEDEEDEEALPHSEFLDIFEEGLARLVQDPLLCDLPIQVGDLIHTGEMYLFDDVKSSSLTNVSLLSVALLQVTLEEVNSQVALEYGQAMTVRVCKADGEVMREFLTNVS